MTVASGSSHISCDVLVIGGGLAGSALAIACAGAGVRVVSVDRLAPVERAAEPFDGKTYAIALGSKRLLDGIGIWSELKGEVQPILEIRVADNHAPLFLHYDHREIGSDPFGWIVESRWLRAACSDRMNALPTLVQAAPASPVEITRTAEGVRAVLNDGRKISARLLVAADGRASGLRKEAGIGVKTHAYGQDGIVCTVEHARPHHGIAVEHFMPSGPFAILPMRGNRSSIVWTEKTALAEKMMALDMAGFEREVARRFGDFLGEIRVVGPRWRYPLTAVLAERMTDTRMALLGDAAHGIHPIAGQGLNLGLRDVAVLAELIVDAVRIGLDPGSASLLDAYRRRRRFDTLALTAVTDTLNRLFSNDIKPLKLFRDIGLAAVGTKPLTPLRRILMRHAMGTLGAQPRLTSGKAL